MTDIPVAWQFGLLALLLLASGFFSIAETSMMALNRYRLKALVKLGHRGARIASELLARTDRLLGAILLGNTLVAAGAATLAADLAYKLFGDGQWVPLASAVAVTFALLIFAEITPKVIGAAHAERIAVVLSYVLKPLLTASYPVVWFINLFVSALLWLMRFKPQRGDQRAAMVHLDQRFQAIAVQRHHAGLGDGKKAREGQENGEQPELPGYRNVGQGRRSRNGGRSV